MIGSYDGEDDVVIMIPDEEAVISTDARRKHVELSANTQCSKHVQPHVSSLSLGSLEHALSRSQQDDAFLICKPYGQQILTFDSIAGYLMHVTKKIRRVCIC